MGHRQRRSRTITATTALATTSTARRSSRVDADTGKLKWHYQFSPHDEFDWDATQVPVLADIDFNGSPRKVMMWANRNGVFYVLDRTNGQFLSGKSFVKTNWFTGFDEKGRPMRAPGILPTTEGTLVYPGNQGGTNWYNPSFSPVTGLFYIPAWENSSSIYRKGEDPPEFHDGQSFTGTGPGRGGATDDVFSSIIAMDPKTRRAQVDLPHVSSVHRRRRAHHRFECVVRRRPRRTVRRSGCPRWQAAVGDQSRAIRFRRSHELTWSMESSM